MSTTVGAKGLDATASRTGGRVRLVDAALSCIERAGTRKTTVDDIAREAGVSRATLYRAFPGGKEAIFDAVIETELARFFSTLAVSMGRAADVGEVLVSGITISATYLGHHSALRTLLDVEPELILTHLIFGQMDAAIDTAVVFATPFFARWLEPDQAARVGETAVRILVSYLMNPSPYLDLEDEASVRRFVDRYVLPGVSAIEARPSFVRSVPTPTLHPVKGS